ncbi:aldehyde dehydrogenase [Azorhizobium sp. AG788]|uniref:aldehyde dehydrogenase n=1 Tax=Azorhizobium sp. AG788 TaxID=2183897 RepID=UPI00313953AF
MSEMIVVEERNQDDMSRMAGCYLYADTRMWVEDKLVHRGEGPAIIGPDGVERWYIRGRDVTRDVKTFFYARKWPVGVGLDTPEKLALFQGEFLK